MTLPMLQTFFMWCSIINIAWLMLVFLIFLTAADWVYKTHGRWFSFSRTTFDAIFYSFIGLFKMLIIVFNIVPWIALSIIS
jgi:hypothetical protein